MNPWMDLATDGLSTWRLARLVAEDDITAGARDAIIRHAYRSKRRLREVHAKMVHEGYQPHIPGQWADWVIHKEEDPPKLCTLVTCMFCVGVYSGFGVSLARSLFPRQWRWVSRFLALASLGVLVAGLEKD